MGQIGEKNGNSKNEIIRMKIIRNHGEGILGITGGKILRKSKESKSYEMLRMKIIHGTTKKGN